MVRISRSLIMYGYIAGGPQKEPVFTVYLEHLEKIRMGYVDSRLQVQPGPDLTGGRPGAK